MSGKTKSNPINFLMVGCQRCGTTWVDAALREHPRIYLPPEKQTYFFDQHYDRGVSWYLSQFQGVGDETAVGEVATGYCLPHAVERLAALLPDVKLVMAMHEHHFEAAHIPGSVRLLSLEDAEAHLQRDDDIVVYCSDRACVASRVAAEKLIDAGYAKVRHYPGGLSDWQAAGYPLEGSMVG